MASTKKCRLIDQSKWNEIECKIKNPKKLLLKLTRANKANHFKFFIENKLNFLRLGR